MPKHEQSNFAHILSYFPENKRHKIVYQLTYDALKMSNNWNLSLFILLSLTGET